jgi:hypothetical protein
MNLLSQVAQTEIQWQASKDVESSSRTSQEYGLRFFYFSKKGKR